MKNKRREKRTSAVARGPVAILPGVEISAVLAAAKATVKGGGKIIEWVKSERPLLLQILESRRTK